VGPGGILNGTPVVQGFVADTGRLPASIAELASQSISTVYAFSPYVNFTPLTKSDGTGLVDGSNNPYLAVQGSGWRGPYLQQDQDPQATYGGSFRDGWGNASSASLVDSSPPDGQPATSSTIDGLNSGWALFLPGNVTARWNGGTYLVPPFTADGFASPPNNTFVWKSYGSDDLDDGTAYPNGAPAGSAQASAATPAWDGQDYLSTLSPDDYLVRVASWQVTISFTSTLYAGQSIYLRLYYPTTPVPSPSAWNVSTTLTYVQTTAVAMAPAGQPTVFPVGFSYPTAGTSWPANPANGDVRVPMGPRCLAVFLASASDAPLLLSTYQPGSTTTSWVAQIPVTLSPRAPPTPGPFYLVTQ
jgi:hypothetical protein